MSSQQRSRRDPEAKSHATWAVSLACVSAAVACRDCAAQTQRRRQNSDESAGRQALEGQQTRREAWAGRRLGLAWRLQGGPRAGAGEPERWRGAQERSGGERRQLLTASPVGEPRSLSKIDPRRRGAALGTGERERERERGSEAGMAARRRAEPPAASAGQSGRAGAHEDGCGQTRAHRETEKAGNRNTGDTGGASGREGPAGADLSNASFPHLH